MSRNLKALCLALVAAFAMSAVVASAASAAPEFNVEAASSEHPAILVGEGYASLVTVEETVGCGATLEGNTKLAHTTSQTLYPTWSGCGSIKWENNGCSFKFNMIGKITPAKAKMDIVCAPSKMIVTTDWFGCRQEVGPQTGLEVVEYSNSGSGSTRTIGANFAIKGITYTLAGACTFKGTFNTGSYKAENTTISAYTDQLVQQGLWVL